MNYRDCYRNGVAQLIGGGVPEPENDARLLLEFACGTDRNTLLAHGDMPVEEERRIRYEEMIAKRSHRIPLQLLTGEQEFCGLTFLVNENVLIPRQDTEILVETALKKLKPGMRLLDMCTGSGCILISLLSMVNGVCGVGADVSEKALEVARENGLRLLDKEGQPCWYCSDLFCALPEEPFDIIVSNPPYIRSEVIDTLMPEVKDFEPLGALDGSADGLLFYKRIVNEGTEFLKDGGFLIFEIGYDQGLEVKTLMETAGYRDVVIINDYAGLDRVVVGQRI